MYVIFLLCLHLSIQNWIQLSIHSNEVMNQEAIYKGMFYLYRKPEQRSNVNTLALYYINLAYDAKYKVVFCEYRKYDIVIMEVIMVIGKSTNGKYEITESRVCDKYNVIKIYHFLYMKIQIVVENYLFSNNKIKLKYIDNVYLYDDNNIIQCDIIGTFYEKGKAILLYDTNTEIEVNLIFIE